MLASEQTGKSVNESRSPTQKNAIQILGRRFIRNPLSSSGFLIVLFLVIIALSAKYWVPFPEDILTARRMDENLRPPSEKYWMGTDHLGRDIFSRVMVGTGLSLQVGVTVVLLSATLGTFIGGIAGYYGGWIDQVTMRITDGFLAFPSLVLALGVAAALGPSLMNALLSITIAWWPWYARLVRAQALSVSNLEFIEAAQALGSSRFRILIRHILPNVLVPVIVQASLDFGYVVLTATSLSFLGLGAQRPFPEWGLMVSEGRNVFPASWWVSIFPGLAIFITVIAFNLLGDGIREMLDPRMRNRV
ncbi:MAG: D-ala-D-ala transporter subunit [Chloroflexi bacterium RBG_19FT_COMBO_50_10]|nr:MAG: D-ala-D-ala transporter subunit [Chloroflexi bacterium RBG_16_47_49]OGO66332.1 MAG: D-ala-D-ala transporter subunit [Chloroflexi bacterium RBG_19FT_COMBO_50_10]